MKINACYGKAIGLALAGFILGWATDAESTAVLIASARANPGEFSPDPEIQDGGFGATAAFATQTSVFGGSTFVGSASASATYGSLGAFAAATLTNYQPGSFFTQNPPFPPSGRDPAVGEAGFQDTLTITGASGTAFLFLGFRADGFATGSGRPTGTDNAQAIIDIWDGALGTGVVVDSDGFRDTGFVSAALPFTYGTPFTFGHTLYAFTDVFSLDFLQSLPYDYSGFADFSSTSRLTEFSVFADAGLQNRVLDYDLSTESGVDYGMLVSVPEPSLIYLLALGLGLAARQRQSRL